MRNLHVYGRPPVPGDDVFARWVNEAGPADLPHIIRESLDDLKAVTAGR